MKLFTPLTAFVMVLSAASNAIAVASDKEHCLTLFLGDAYEQAASVCRRAAGQGDATARYIIGAMYYEGVGVIQDYQEAMKWFRLIADQGDAEAQYIIGTMYAEGKGVMQDEQEAYIWYTVAAANGNEDAAEAKQLAAKELSSDALNLARQEAVRREQEIENQ